MTVRSEPLGKRDGMTFNPGKIGALITAAVSWLTTYWCVLWIMEPKPEQGYTMVIAVSIVVELILTLMKRCLFNADKSDDGIGWVGLIVDTVINAGGILPRAARFLTFPPIAAILSVVGIQASTVDAAGNVIPNPSVVNIGGFIVAIIAGALLSVLPHRLWKSGD